MRFTIFPVLMNQVLDAARPHYCDLSWIRNRSNDDEPHRMRTNVSRRPAVEENPEVYSHGMTLIQVTVR